MQIAMLTIQHKLQRYPTAGDWHWDADGVTLTVVASETGDWRYNALIQIHELVEALLCKARGISEEAVTAFDLAHSESADPGGDTAAPYYWEHRAATMVEEMVARMMGVDWDTYENALIALDAGDRRPPPTSEGDP